MSTKSSAKSDAVATAVAMGLMGGGLAMIAHGLQQHLRSAARRPPVVIGGVDVSSTDLTQPFVANFSTLPFASVDEKRAALTRLSSAYHAFYQWKPYWILRTDVDVDSGRFVLVVTPTESVFGRMSFVRAT